MFSECLVEGTGVKPTKWLEKTKTASHECWEEFKNGGVKNIKIESRVRVFQDLVDVIMIPFIKSDCYVQIARLYFHSGVNALAELDFKKGLHSLKECYTPIHEARACGNNLPNNLVIDAECKVLDDDVLMHICIAESMQARAIGKGMFILLHQCKWDNNSLDFPMVKIA